MKKIILAAVLCVAASTLSAQTLGDILGGTKLGTIVNAVTGTSGVTAANLLGQWKYTTPAVEFSSDNLLQKAGGAVVASQVESKLSALFTKAGIRSGNVTFSFASGGVFSCKYGTRTIPGTYTLNAETGALMINFTMASGVRIATFEGKVTMADGNLSVLFNADKIMSIVKVITASSTNTTLKTINSVVNGYSGMMAGFKFTK